MFKRLLTFFLILNLAVHAQNTTNIGFEDGTFNNWKCLSGTIDASGVIDVIPVPPTQYRHTIIGNVPDLDPFGHFPIHCPNGSKYSVKLSGTNQGEFADRITYSLVVPTTGAYSILCNYAIVLCDPGHAALLQPRFTVKVFDVTDSLYVACPSFDFFAPNLPGFKLSDMAAANTPFVYYKDWSTAAIDLANYHGKTIRLEFTVNHCSPGGHFGYAYLDIQENSSPITGNAYCTGQTSISLRGPDGFSDYVWYTADFSKIVGEGQSLSISPAPPNLTQYALKVLPFPGLGCIDTLYTVVNKIDDGFKLSVASTVLGCIGTGVDLTAAAVTAGSSPDMTFSYFRDSLATVNLYSPDAVDSAGVYYIKGINTEGCTNILPVHVAFRKVSLEITEPADVNFPATIDLTKTFIHETGYNYEFYSDPEGNDKLINYTAINHSGEFYIKALNQYGCDTIAPVNVIIHPPPPSVITAPNTFTPNNDGINDHFALTAIWNLTYNSLKIFNRYGQLVFTAKSFSEYWDGNYNGKSLPSGEYYWIFEGRDDYSGAQIKQSGATYFVAVTFYKYNSCDNNFVLRLINS